MWHHKISFVFEHSSVLLPWTECWFFCLDPSFRTHGFRDVPLDDEQQANPPSNRLIRNLCNLQLCLNCYTCTKCPSLSVSVRLSLSLCSVGKFYCKPHYCYRLSGQAQRKRPAPPAAAPLQPKVNIDASFNFFRCLFTCRKMQYDVFQRCSFIYIYIYKNIKNIYISFFFSWFIFLSLLLLKRLFAITNVVITGSTGHEVGLYVEWNNSLTKGTPCIHSFHPGAIKSS